MDLFVWGANSHGQLGLGRYSELVDSPVIIQNIPENISELSCGGGHSALLSTGDLFLTGWNNKGQLGDGTTVDKCVFNKLEFNRKFAKVFCGWDRTAAITEENQLLVWGSNMYNQLGFSNSTLSIIKRPKELSLPFNDPIDSVHFGLRHTAFLTTSCVAYIVGSLKHFKNSPHEIINHNSTEYLRLNCEIHHIASGQNHISYADDRNTIQGIGDNKFMQCSKIEQNAKIIRLSSGWTHNGFLTDNRELYTFGRNCYGQLGNDSRCDSLALPQKCQIHPVDDFALGAEHGILLSRGEIYTWGWNEHGNCGNGCVDDV